MPVTERTRGDWTAVSSATQPPSELPATWKSSIAELGQRLEHRSPPSGRRVGAAPPFRAGEPPKPGRSIAITWCRSASAGMHRIPVRAARRPGRGGAPAPGRSRSCRGRASTGLYGEAPAAASPAPPRACQQHLDVADPALREAGLAVREVERPQPAEALVVAQRRGSRGLRLEALAASCAASARSCAVMSRTPCILSLVTRATQSAITAIEGRQPPGKIWVLMKERFRFSSSKASSGHRDGLDQHQSVGLEQLSALGEEGVERLPPHRLDHLDRHELRVAARRGRGSRTRAR